MLSGLAQPVASLGGVGLGVGRRVSVSSGCVATGAGWSWQAEGTVGGGPLAGVEEGGVRE